jgi:hypothetical protein
MVSQDKKFGGNPICRTRVRAYMDCMDYCHLLNLGFSGPKFTWTNMRGVADLIQERIDRAWATSTWKLLFPKASVHHLARLNSDHCPLLLKLDLPSPPSTGRPFRFQPCWLNHPDFPRVVKEVNRINGIKDGAGNWLYNLDDVKDHFVSGFKSLYQTEQLSCELTPTPFPC